MSEENQSNDQQAAGSDTPSSDATGPAVTAGRKSGNLRFKILLFLLGLTLFALWYDYQIARPKVETAYEKIMALNVANINTGKSDAPQLMTNLDIQKTLGVSRVIHILRACTRSKFIAGPLVCLSRPTITTRSM